MNLIEMAVNEYRKELISNGKIEKPVDDPSKAGRADDTIYYLTGKKSKYSFTEESVNMVLNNKQNIKDNYLVTALFKEEDKSLAGGKILTKHAYHVNRVTEDTEYVVNPHDSSKEIAYPKDKFLANTVCVTQTFIE